MKRLALLLLLNWTIANASAQETLIRTLGPSPSLKGVAGGLRRVTKSATANAVVAVLLVTVVPLIAAIGIENTFKLALVLVLSVAALAFVWWFLASAIRYGVHGRKGP
jgi:hypothetical protein